jgi:hypothetical protein
MGVDEVKIAILRRFAVYSTKKTLRCILEIHRIAHVSSESKARLQSLLKNYIKQLVKGKETNIVDATRLQQTICDLRESWPKLVPNNLKDRIISMFRDETSSGTLVEFTCASCAECCSLSDRHEQRLHEVDLAVVKRPDIRVHRNLSTNPVRTVDKNWLMGGSLMYEPIGAFSFKTRFAYLK